MSEEHRDLVQKTINANVAEAMEHGPGLRYTTRLVVLCRDPVAGRSLLQGFGPFGVGRMWCKDDEWVRDLPGYATAPTQDAPRPDAVVVKEDALRESRLLRGDTAD